MNVTVKKLTELRRLEKNVRRHNDKQIGEYIRSLKMFGQIRPMVVDETGTILVGNGMYEAMLRMGWTEGDCYIVDGLTEKQKTKLMLADNRVYELGMTDMDAFDEIIADLAGDFDIPGWDSDLLETLSASIVEADEMVQNYGVFTQKEVQRVQDRERFDHTAPESTSAPLQRASGVTETHEEVPHRAEEEASTVPIRAVTERTVICPHCGKEFAISLIGGE